MKTKKALHYILSLATVLGVVVFITMNTTLNTEFRFDLYLEYGPFIFKGFMWTILISVITFVLSMVLGFLMFFADRSRIPYIRYMTEHFTSFMFGSPMLVVVIVFYFFIGGVLKNDSQFFMGTAALTLYFSPFMMKLYIGAYESLDRNQIIVCDLFGFSKWQMYRYVILPQMFRVMLPPLSGNLATIIKSTSLLYLIGFSELYYTLTTVQARTFAYTEGYLIMMILYLIITIPLLRLTDYLEKRIKL